MLALPLVLALVLAPPEPAPDDEGNADDDEEEASREPRAVLRAITKFIQPTVLFEADYRQHGDPVDGAAGFVMDNARLGLRVTPTQWITAVGTVEFAEPEGVMLLDAYVEFELKEWLEITIGYAKPPLFALFRHEGAAGLPMPGRSAVVNEMRVRRDLGVELRLRPRAVPLEAIVRLGEGSMGLVGDGTRTPTGYAALDLVLGRAWAGGESERLGLRFGLVGMVDETSERESIAGATPLGYVYVEPVPVAGLRARATAHAVGYVGPVRLVAEAGFAHERRDYGEPSVVRDPVRTWGLTAELNWTIRGPWRELGRPPAVASLLDGPWDRGALELSVRADRLWLGRGTDELLDSGGTSAALALKWWPTGCLGLTIYGDATRFDIAPIETPARLWGGTFLLRASFVWD